MAAMQNVALFLLFTSIEKDLVHHIRTFSDGELRLTREEIEKAQRRMESRSALSAESGETLDLLFGLDLGEKFDALRRHKEKMDYTTRAYFDSLADIFQKILPVRNSVMHGRPLLINEQVLASSLFNRLMSTSAYWPHLKRSYEEYAKDPASFLSRSINFFESSAEEGVLHNLPKADYADTGFMPRPALEKDLQKKILGRYPVVTVLGDGGNGKTALALQTLYGLVSSDNHGFEAILWYTAKTARLTENGIGQIADVVTDSMSIVRELAELEPGNGSPMTRLKTLLTESKILLVIDNLETVTGPEIKALATDLPGESKLLITSRVPMGGDISVHVGEFSEAEAAVYLQRLIQAHDVQQMKRLDPAELKKYASRLGLKPLLLKWLVLGVKKGLSPDAIVANPEDALRFCLDNVIDRLTDEAEAVVVVLATIPMPCSPSLIREVSDLSPSAIMKGLNELAMFGLVGFEKGSGSEQSFKIRPLVRSYITRIVAPKPALTSEMLVRYRRVDGQFQRLRARPTDDPYDVRTITVRSRSEMLSSDNMAQVISACFNQQFDVAERIVEDLKTLDPGYFEVYRVEAFLAQQMGDSSRACASFETALELEPKEPQLWYFFGIALMRQLENLRAGECFRRAIELGGDRFPVLRDAARNEFMQFNFPAAEDYVARAIGLPGLTERQRVMGADLSAQLLIRKMEYLIQNGKNSEAAGVADRLVSYLEELPGNLADGRFIEHIEKSLPCFDDLIAQSALDPALLDRVEAFLDVHGALRAGGDPRVENHSLRRGTLKVAGTGTYGFLREADGTETFVHRSATSAPVWRRLVRGELALFTTEVGRTGRPQACDITLAGAARPEADPAPPVAAASPGGES